MSASEEKKGKRRVIHLGNLPYKSVWEPVPRRDRRRLALPSLPPRPAGLPPLRGTIGFTSKFPGRQIITAAPAGRTSERIHLRLRSTKPFNFPLRRRRRRRREERGLPGLHARDGRGGRRARPDHLHAAGKSRTSLPFGSGEGEEGGKILGDSLEK